ncbi:MAG TPA: hypothetical protein VL068_04525 [Microthrixaceae bacterium]|nr:hypothetical protein [Microthrixaceae bacterium]
MRSRRQRNVFWLAAIWFVACSLLLTACRNSERPVALAPGRSETPPFDLETRAGAAVRGEELVVAQQGTNRIAVRWADGSWSEAPGIKAEGFWYYRTVGPTVVAGGYQCESMSDESGCEGVTPSFYRLAADLSGWQKLDSPKPTQPLTANVEVRAEQGLRAWALFSVGGADTFLVGTDGTVKLLGEGFLCAISDTVVEAADVTVGSLGYAQLEESFTTFKIRSLAKPSDPPVVVAAPEPIPMLGQAICGAGYVSIVAPNGETEWALNVSDGTVTRFESNTNAVGAQGATGVEAGAATSPDGNTLFKRTGANGRTMRRTGLGLWEDTGLELSGVWATDSGVIGLKIGANTFIELPET